MSIPHYHIVRSAVEQQMHEQFRNGPELDGPEGPEHQHNSVPVAMRARLSAMLHTLANAIEPSRPGEDCIPSRQT